VITNSVVLDGAVIEHPVTLRDPLVFPGGQVRAADDLERRIVTPDHVIDCR
jgi:hypothetical protein